MMKGLNNFSHKIYKYIHHWIYLSAHKGSPGCGYSCHIQTYKMAKVENSETSEIMIFKPELSILSSSQNRENSEIEKL